MYYVLLPKEIDRKSILEEFQRNGISSVFHYVPLHSSPAGKSYGKTHGTLINTENLSSRLIRLPLWIGLSRIEQEKVVNVLSRALGAT